MSLNPSRIPEAAVAYCDQKGCQIKDCLGSGIQGTVFSTTQQTAIKAFYKRDHYQREKQIYIRLRDRDFRSAHGFNVPRMLGLSDRLMVIEMEVVQPPFVVDFAGAYLDERPPIYLDQEAYEDWEEQRIELFGEDDWVEVRMVLAAFRRVGVWLNDVKPGNITVRD